jgi:hypothetical protein
MILHIAGGELLVAGAVRNPGGNPGGSPTGPTENTKVKLQSDYIVRH